MEEVIEMKRYGVKVRSTRGKYSSKIERAMDPIRGSKFFAKGWLRTFMRSNPKASKKTKLRVWREGYLDALFRHQKR